MKKKVSETGKYNDHKKWWMFPGRWQPLHNGHMALLEQALGEGKNIWIAVRDTEISENNPYSTEQRIEMIKRTFGDLYGKKIIATSIPDIEGIRYGRGVGYKVEAVEMPKNIEEISATNIRAGKDKRLHKRIHNYINLLQSTIWLTGLPCAGKTTISKRLIEELNNKTYSAVSLDGDDIRTTLNADLGFSSEDRKENLRRIACMSKIFNDRKNLVVASFVSPTQDLREMIKGYIGEDRFHLVYIKCPLEVCEQRDVKGMYAKARKGEIKEFTGVDAPFEEPENPDCVVNTEELDLEASVSKILKELDI